MRGNKDEANLGAITNSNKVGDAVVEKPRCEEDDSLKEKRVQMDILMFHKLQVKTNNSLKWVGSSCNAMEGNVRTLQQR